MNSILDPESDGANSHNPVSKFGKKIYNYLNRQNSLNNNSNLIKTTEALKESDTRQTLLEAEEDEDGEEEDEETDSHSNNEDENDASNLSNEESNEENATESTRLTDAKK